MNQDSFLRCSLVVYTACGDSIARIFDAKSGALKRECKGHVNTITAIQVRIVDHTILYLILIYSFSFAKTSFPCMAILHRESAKNVFLAVFKRILKLILEKTNITDMDY